MHAPSAGNVAGAERGRALNVGAPGITAASCSRPNLILHSFILFQMHFLMHLLTDDPETAAALASVFLP